MGVRKNPDGSITVGVLTEEVKEKAAEKKETPSPQPSKKPAKKKE